MEPALREYIRDVYRSLTDIGTQADQTVDARFLATDKSTQNGAPAIKVTQPGKSVRLSEPRSPAPGAPANRPSVANPFGVVAAAVRAITRNRAPALWLALLVVAPSTILSNVLILENVRRGPPFDARWAQLGALAIAIYLLCWWIRVGNSGVVKASAAVKFADVLAFGAIAAFGYFLWPLVANNQGVPMIIRWSAILTHYWPLNGPYASMTFPSVNHSYLTMPPETSFGEPFAQAISLLAALPFVPFIVGGKGRVAAKLGHLLVRIPFLLVALALCTLPIAILNASLADWANAMVKSGNPFPACLVMALALYVQLLLSAVTIGEFYRRVAARHP